MMDFIADDPEFRRQQAESRYDQQAMFDDLVDDNEPDDDDLQADLDELVGDPKTKRTDWQLSLERARDGSVKGSVANLATIIANDARIRPCVEFNAFREQVVTRKPLKTRLAVVARIPIRDRANGDVWQDQHTDALRILLEAPNGPKLPGWGLKLSYRDLQAAIANAARLAPFHPVRERLAAVPEQGAACGNALHRFPWRRGQCLSPGGGPEVHGRGCRPSFRAGAQLRLRSDLRRIAGHESLPSFVCWRLTGLRN